MVCTYISSVFIKSILSCKSLLIFFFPFHHLPARCATTSAVTLRAAQKKNPTRPETASASRLLLILPKEKTALTATVLPPKPECRTTAAGDTEVEAGSPLQFVPHDVSRELCSSHDIPLTCKSSFSHTHTSYHTLHWQWVRTDSYVGRTDDGFADTDNCLQEPCNDLYDTHNSRGDM